METSVPECVEEFRERPEIDLSVLDAPLSSSADDLRNPSESFPEKPKIEPFDYSSIPELDPETLDSLMKRYPDPYRILYSVIKSNRAFKEENDSLTAELIKQIAANVSLQSNITGLNQKLVKLCDAACYASQMKQLKYAYHAEMDYSAGRYVYPPSPYSKYRKYW